VLILYPLDPNVVTASLVAPSVSNICDDLIMDTLTSYGNGAAPWKLIEWVVESATVNATKLSNFLNAHFSVTLGIIVVPELYLELGSYTVVLSLTNQFGIAGASSRVVNVHSKALLPRVLLSGPNFLYRSDPFSAFAAVSLPSCSGRRFDFVYVWSLYESDGMELVPYESASIDARYFKLDPYVLNVDTKYVLSVNVSVTGGELSSSALEFSVGRQGVVAVISGGSTDSVAASVGVLAVSATGSYHADYRLTPEHGPPLDFLWSCLEQEPNFGVSCDTAIASNSAPSVSVDMTSLSGVEEFSLSVIVNSSTDVSIATKDFVVRVGSPPPQILLVGLLDKYDPSERIILSCNISALQNCNSEWKLIDELSGTILDIDSFVLTSATRVLAVGQTNFQLTIAKNVLNPGSKYTLEISTSYLESGSGIGFSRTTVTMNAPPEGGRVSVAPTVGVELNTSFSLYSDQWLDDVEDLPFSYVYIQYNSDSNAYSVIKEESFLSATTALLRRGLVSLNYSIVCEAHVSDIYGSTGVAGTHVQVFQSAQSWYTSDAIAILETRLSESVASNDNDALFQIIAGYSAVFNSANCSTAPNCTTLNRYPCDVVAGTCGLCVSGYEVGDDGYANTPCYFIRCSCEDGWYGSDCSITSQEFSLILSAKETMCQSLHSSLEQQDVTPPVILARSISIVSLFLDLKTISDNAYKMCTQVIVDTVKLHPTVAATDSALLGVIASLSAILDRELNISVTLENSIYSTIEALSLGRQGHLASGEVATNIYSKNLRYLTQLSYSEDLTAGSMILLPQSALEKLRGVSASACSIDTTAKGTTSSAGVSVWQFRTNINSPGANSSIPISMQIFSYGDILESPPTQEVLIVLQNSRDIDYREPPELTSTTICYETTDELPYFVNTTCHNGYIAELECPGFKEITIRYNCSQEVVHPVCLFWNGSSYIQLDGCSVVDYDAQSTTCKCN
ncbi:unnamed protein product, partial [Ectocarpus fasciculatus]